MKSLHLNITAGNLRSRKVHYYQLSSLRPTKTYVRELIFNVCRVENYFNVLDLFAGSGILSAESISRGAKSAHLVESDRSICHKISEEFNKLNIRNYEIHNKDVLKFLANEPTNDYHMIYIDPPYNKQIIKEVYNLLAAKKFIKNNKYLYFEHSKQIEDASLLDLISVDYKIIKNLSIGGVSYTIAEKRVK
tara:strand:+ start:1869 stop:2441 length:573 start_codon:yes stop_codon:yes gene_type:complete